MLLLLWSREKEGVTRWDAGPGPEMKLRQHVETLCRGCLLILTAGISNHIIPLLKELK